MGRTCGDEGREIPLQIDLEQRPINKLQEQLLAAYDQLVKTPEDRTRLEKTNPELVAERDRIVTAQKRVLRAHCTFCFSRKH